MAKIKRISRARVTSQTSLASADFSSSGSRTWILRSGNASRNLVYICSSDFVSFRNLGSTEEISCREIKSQWKSSRSHYRLLYIHSFTYIKVNFCVIVGFHSPHYFQLSLVGNKIRLVFWSDTQFKRKLKVLLICANIKTSQLTSFPYASAGRESACAAAVAPSIPCLKHKY